MSVLLLGRFTPMLVSKVCQHCNELFLLFLKGQGMLGLQICQLFPVPLLLVRQVIPILSVQSFELICFLSQLRPVAILSVLALTEPILLSSVRA